MIAAAAHFVSLCNFEATSLSQAQPLKEEATREIPVDEILNSHVARSAPAVAHEEERVKDEVSSGVSPATPPEPPAAGDDGETVPLLITFTNLFFFN